MINKNGHPITLYDRGNDWLWDSKASVPFLIHYLEAKGIRFGLLRSFYGLKKFFLTPLWGSVSNGLV